MEAYRKIELQAPEDFAYLIGNVRRAAADSVAAAFPPVEGGDAEEDELRVRIEQLVNDYIRQTFTLAAPNLTINGLPVSPGAFLESGKKPNKAKRKKAASSGQDDGEEEDEEEEEEEEHFEPFDGRKRQRVEDLAREEEDLLREIASLKRRVPAAAAASLAERMRAGLLADAEALEAERRRGTAASVGGGGEDDDAGADAAGATARRTRMLGGVGPLERQEGVEESWAAAVGALGRLTREMPAAVAKMERARVAGEYVVTGR